MRFGVHLPNFGEVADEPATLVSLAIEAESAGWDGFFLWDHILGDPAWRTEMLDPWIVLAAIAAATHTIRIGALVTAVPRRRPWHLARETATLDVLSGGRLVVGVGLGNPREAEFEHFGEDGDTRRRARRLDEGLAILVGLWSGEPFAFEGSMYRIRETVFLPTPLQRPRPPVWVAAHWPARPPLQRAARWDGVFPEHPGGGRLSPSELDELLAYIRQQRASADPFDVVMAGRASDLAAGELDMYARHGLTWWLEAVMPNDALDEARARIAAGPAPERSLPMH